MGLDVVGLGLAKADAAKRYLKTNDLRRRDLPGEVGIPSVMASGAPTVTIPAGGTAITITNNVVLDSVTNAGQFTVLGANLSRVIDATYSMPDNITPRNAAQLANYSVTVLTDSPDMEWNFRNSGGKFTLLVNGQKVQDAPFVLGGDGQNCRVRVTFASRAMRRLTLIADSQSPWRGITVNKIDTVLPGGRRGRRYLAFGDSYVEGVGTQGVRYEGAPYILGQMLGLEDIWITGSGGTGLTYPSDQTGSNAGRVTYGDRIASNALAYNPDIIGIFDFRNDIGHGATNAQIQTAARSLFQTVRTSLPNALILSSGLVPANAPEAASTTWQAINDIVKAETLAVGGIFLDVMGSNAYITGTGKVGLTNNSGNSDINADNDGIHPSPAGHKALGRGWFARLISQLPA